MFNMKNKHVQCVAVLLLLHLGCFAQVRTASNVDSVQLDESKDIQEQLVPLDSIIDIALHNSPAVKFQQDVTDAAKYQVAFIKSEWTNNIAGFGNYATGNQRIATADSQNPGLLSSSSLSNGYRAGVQVTIPLYNFIGHKSRVDIYKAEWQASIHKSEQARQELAQYLIQLYYALIYSRNLITIRSEAKQTAINQSQVAEHEFKDGVIAASELSRLKTVEVNARADFEEARRQFATNYFQFQNMVGVSMEKLIQKK